MLSASDPLPRASASSPGESPHDSAKIPQLPSESDPRLSPDSAPAAIKLEADSPAKIPVGSFENTAEQAEDKSETITEIVDQGSIDPDISKSADEKAQIAGMPTQETIRLPSIAQSITSGGPPNLPAGNMFLSPLPPLNNMPISSSQSLTGRMVNNYLFALPNTPPMRAQNTTSSEQDREMYAPYQHIQNAPAPILSQHFNTNWYHGGYQPYPHYIHQQYQYRPDINYPTLPLQTNYENFDQRYPAHQIHPVHPNHTLTKADSSDEEVFDQGEAGNADNLLIMSAKDVIAEEVNTDGRVRKMYPCPTPGCNKTFTRRYNLQSHLMVHTGKRPFVCNQCGTSFSRQHDLRRHVRSLHSEDRPHHCVHCNLSFARSDALKRHLASESKREGEGGAHALAEKEL